MDKQAIENLKQVTLLYVEDSEVIIQELLPLLQKQFKAVYHAQNGQKALELFKEHQPDLILTDIKMPQTNGLEFIEALKEFDKDTPIIISTAHTEAKYLLKAIDLGVNGYVLKPMRLTELFEKLSKSVEKVILKRKNAHMHKVLSHYKIAVDKSTLVSKTDKNAVITYANDRFLEVSKYTPKELIGRSHNIIRHPDEDPAIYKSIWATLKRKEMWQGVIKNRAKDGSTYVVNASIFPILGEQGNVEEYIAVRHDVTAMYETQEKLLHKSNFFKTLLDAQENLVVLCDKNKKLIECNKHFLEHFNVPNIEAFMQKYQGLEAIFNDNTGFIQPHHEKDWLEHLTHDKSKTHKAVLKSTNINQQVFTIAVSYLEEEKLYMISMTNVTDLEDALVKAQSAQKAKTSFLARMSHEIRTPLNAMMGFIEILKEKEENYAKLQYLNTIDKSSNSLLAIINDILDLSKIESGKLNIEMIETNLFTELLSTLSLFYTKAREKGLNLSIYMDPRIPEHVITDILRLKQVISNLLSNAIKFTSNKGLVEFKAFLEDGHICFEVKDNGIGIAKENLQKIFDEFNQEDTSITRRFGGTGLGLSISSYLVQRLGGGLHVESTLGVGSRFYFTIPLQTQTEKEPVSRCSISHYHAEFFGFSKCCHNKEILVRYLHTFGIHKIETLNSLEELKDDANALTFVSSRVDLKTIKELNIKKQGLIVLRDIESEKLQKEQQQLTRLVCPFIPSTLFEAIIKCTEKSQEQIVKEKEKNSFFKGRILLVEDMLSSQQFMKIILNSLGLEVELANNGKEAVEMFCQNAYDLILMDENMPVMSGLEATKEILAYESEKKLQHTPIVALTANAIKGDRERFLNAGMDEYLSKPINKQRLSSVLEHFLLA